MSKEKKINVLFLQTIIKKQLFSQIKNWIIKSQHILQNFQIMLDILCESYIIVNIKKAGRYKILYNGGVEDTNHWCYEVPNHTPKRITINEN